jgi:hypothetical protein
MAYRCPVCEEPQADAEHLANHLAFTAMLGDDDHESWLDDSAPGWEQEDDAGLAARLRDQVETVDHPIDDVETHGPGHDHERADATGPAEDRLADHYVGGVDRGPAALDEEAREIVSEARELTRKMETEETDSDAEADGSPSDEGETE